MAAHVSNVYGNQVRMRSSEQILRKNTEWFGSSKFKLKTLVNQEKTFRPAEMGSDRAGRSAWPLQSFCPPGDVGSVNRLLLEIRQWRR